MQKKYLIDANVFIQAKNLHYRFDFCGGFWNWLLAAHQAGLVYSIQKVKDELLKGDDDDLVKQWAIVLPASFFLADSKDPNVMGKYADAMKWSVNNQQYSQAAKNDFASASAADAYLIAAAMRHDYQIVTQEKSSPAAVRRIPIPDAAKALGIQTTWMYDFLSAHAESTFQLKQA